MHCADDRRCDGVCDVHLIGAMAAALPTSELSLRTPARLPSASGAELDLRVADRTLLPNPREGRALTSIFPSTMSRLVDRGETTTLRRNVLRLAHPRLQ